MMVPRLLTRASLTSVSKSAQISRCLERFHSVEQVDYFWQSVAGVEEDELRLFGRSVTFISLISFRIFRWLRIFVMFGIFRTFKILGTLGTW